MFYLQSDEILKESDPLKQMNKVNVAYKKLMLKNHPDKTTDPNLKDEKMKISKIINQQKDIVTKCYDMNLSAGSEMIRLFSELSSPQTKNDVNLVQRNLNQMNKIITRFNFSMDEPIANMLIQDILSDELKNKVPRLASRNSLLQMTQDLDSYINKNRQNNNFEKENYQKNINILLDSIFEGSKSGDFTQIQQSIDKVETLLTQPILSKDRSYRSNVISAMSAALDPYIETAVARRYQKCNEILNEVYRREGRFQALKKFAQEFPNEHQQYKDKQAEFKQMQNKILTQEVQETLNELKKSSKQGELKEVEVQIGTIETKLKKLPFANFQFMAEVYQEIQTSLYPHIQIARNYGYVKSMEALDRGLHYAVPMTSLREFVYEYRQEHPIKTFEKEFIKDLESETKVGNIDSAILYVKGIQNGMKFWKDEIPPVAIEEINQKTFQAVQPFLSLEKDEREDAFSPLGQNIKQKQKLSMDSMLNLLQNYRKEHTIQPQQQIQEDILSIQKAVSELKFDVIEKKIDSILQNLKKSNSNTFAKDFEIASSIDTAIRKHIEIAEDNQYAKSLEALNTPKYNERGDISQLETLKAFVKTYAKESPVIFMKNQYIDNISTAVHRQDYSLVTNLISTMRKSLGYERQLTEFDKTEIYSRTKDTLMPMIQDAKNSKLVRSWELGEKLIQTKQPTMRDMIVFSDVFKTEKGMQRGNVREPAVQKAASRNI